VAAQRCTSDRGQMHQDGSAKIFDEAVFFPNFCSARRWPTGQHSHQVNAEQWFAGTGGAHQTFVIQLIQETNKAQSAWTRVSPGLGLIHKLHAPCPQFGTGWRQSGLNSCALRQQLP
jgi:hypothetical protein